MHRIAVTLLMSWMLVGVALASPADAASPKSAADEVRAPSERSSLRQHALAPVVPASPRVNLLEVSDDLQRQWREVEGRQVARARWDAVAVRAGLSSTP